MGTQNGGTTVRVSLKGVLLMPSTSIPSTPLPSVTFGSAPAQSVSVLYSDLDETVLLVQTPRVDAAGAVNMVVAGQAQAEFAYTTDNAAAVCVSALCEVDAVVGGRLTIRVSGVGAVTARTLTATIRGLNVVIVDVTSLGQGAYDVVMHLPGLEPGTPEPEDDVTPMNRTGLGSLQQFEVPLTTEYVALTLPSAVTYATVSFRAPPRVITARLSAEGSRIDFVFDQTTTGPDQATLCDEFVNVEAEGALGRGPICHFEDAGRRLQILLGYGAFVGVGGEICLCVCVCVYICICMYVCIYINIYVTWR
jgi:hypothetical protein